MRSFSERTQIISLLAAALLAGGCSGGAKKGAAIGGAVGAGTGAVIGHQGGRTGTGAIVGGVAGAAAGAIVGDYMERQKKELEKVPGADVKRDQDRLTVTFKDAILFDFDSDAVRPDAAANLRQMADVLVKYPDTDLIVIGHTDNIGSDAYNQHLSTRRATRVKDYLAANAVSRGRLNARGYGETAPVASNATDEGRAQNRRVEVQIAANQALIERAQDQAQAQPR